MSKPQESDTKQRLLDAAMKIFSEKGFIASTVREICQEADVNVAAVNYHFGDKDQLYGTVLQHIFQHYDSHRHEELTKVAASNAPAEERLRAHITVGVLKTYEKDCYSCEHHCSDTDSCCGPYAIFLMEMAHPTAHLDKIVELYIKPDAFQLRDILQAYLGPAADDSVIKNCCTSIWGQILHPAMCWPIGERLLGEEALEIDPQTLAEHIYRFTLGGLQYIKQQLESKTE